MFSNRIQSQILPTKILNKLYLGTVYNNEHSQFTTLHCFQIVASFYALTQTCGHRKIYLRCITPLSIIIKYLHNTMA